MYKKGVSELQKMQSTETDILYRSLHLEGSDVIIDPTLKSSAPMSVNRIPRTAKREYYLSLPLIVHIRNNDQY